MSEQQWQDYAAAIRRRSLARVEWQDARRALGNAHAKRDMGLNKDPHEVARAACRWKSACDELGLAAAAVVHATKAAGDSLVNVGGPQP